MGVAVANFPNLFMIVGPKSRLANVPPVIEAHVEFIAGAITWAEENRKLYSNPSHQKVEIETTKEAEKEWSELCNSLSDKLPYKTSESSHFFGANVEDKVRSVLVFFGGIAMFRQTLQDCVDSGYKCFHGFLIH